MCLCDNVVYRRKFIDLCIVLGLWTTITFGRFLTITFFVVINTPLRFLITYLPVRNYHACNVLLSIDSIFSTVEYLSKHISICVQSTEISIWIRFLITIPVLNCLKNLYLTSPPEMFVFSNIDLILIQSYTTCEVEIDVFIYI